MRDGDGEGLGNGLAEGKGRECKGFVLVGCFPLGVNFRYCFIY